MEKYKIYCGDCEEKLDLIENSSIDLCVTSPPYNVDLGSNKFNKSQYDVYKDNKEHWEYIAWLERIFKKVHKKLKSGGRCAINIGDGKNGRVPTHSDIIHLMTHNLKYLPIANIVWDKSQISNRFSWGSFNSPSCPSFPKPFEYIMIFAKDNIKLQYKGETDLDPEEFKKWAFALWKFPPETKLKKIGHPAVFPVELPHRLIKMLSWKNSNILDPFCGSGTTGIASMRLGRTFIGIELSEKYARLSENRIKNAIPIDIFGEEE